MENYCINVIIADDEIAIRSGLMEAIPWSELHAQVIAAAKDGTEAYNLISCYHPDLVIIDIKMPGMDGLEVIRRTKEAGTDTRFLILSGYNDFSLAQKAIHLGANGYFLKPLKIDEFKDEITRQFSSILRERSQSHVKENIEVLLQTSRAFFLNQLCTNELRNRDEALKRYQLLRFSFVSDSCNAIICSAAISDKDMLKCMLEKALNIIKHEFSDTSCEIWLQDGDRLCGIVNSSIFTKAENKKYTADSSDTIISFRNYMSDLISMVISDTGSRFFMGIGRSVSKLEQIPDSFSSAAQVLSYHLYEQTPDIYDDSVICRLQPTFNPQLIQYEPVIEAMERSDQNSIQNYCREFVDSLFFVPLPPPDFIRGMCIYLINHVRIAFLAAHSETNTDFSFDADNIRKIHSIPELKKWLADSIWGIAGAYRVTKDTIDPIIRISRQFIQEHISDTIKAKDVALQVNLSESYFTIYFKTKTGQNFRDYVLNTKIGHAKRLLRTQNMNISEVAYAVGYQDYRSFSRAFKNVTGVSPSDYQNI